MFQCLKESERIEKAISVFSHARKHSDFYREKYKNTGDVRTYEDWLKIPYLTRTELFNNSFPKSRAMLTMPLERMIVTSTGGSSGIARYGILTYDEWNAFGAVQAEAMKLVGVTERDVVANLFVAGSLWPSFIAVHTVLEKVGAVHLPISANTDMDRILDFILEFKPTVLMSLPTVFVFLADKILQRNLDVSFVKIISYAGEHMSDNIKKHVKTAFQGVNIYALAYTSADCGLIGYQCPYCSATEYHLPTAFQFIDIYDFERNRACGKGEKGEIIVTNLARRSLPIIRYRIGDMGRWKDGVCRCGDKNPVFSLEGRAGADFKVGGAYISMSQVEKALSDFISSDGISANYQLEIEDTDDNKMRITLKVESSDPKRSAAKGEGIKGGLKREIHEFKDGETMGYVSLNVIFVELGELDRSPITGKVKHLNDKRVGG
ncbi:MAG: phenylacetate--CoA ligase family protein [Acidobacteria bacterium]|nr:phenylacetate--CoA ligase family protein [Acidobacteriota bacterium]